MTDKERDDLLRLAAVLDYFIQIILDGVAFGTIGGLLLALAHCAGVIPL